MVSTQHQSSEEADTTQLEMRSRVPTTDECPLCSLPMFSFGGRRQNGGHGKAPIQTQPPAPFEVTESRDLPDGAAKASESAFAPLKIMLLCPVVMPGAQFLSSASQASGLCVPALCSTVHLNIWTRATDTFWLIFRGPLSLACFEEPRGTPSTLDLWLAANPPMPMTTRGPVVCMSARARTGKQARQPSSTYLFLAHGFLKHHSAS